MNTRQAAWLLAVVAVVQLAVPANMLLQRELTLRQGELHRFALAPVDPYDPFRGRYMALNFGDLSVPAEEGHEMARDAWVFALIETDSEGFARITRVVTERPGGGSYLRVRVVSVDASRIRVRLPFDRFYMEEVKAVEADRLLLQRAGDAMNAYVAVRTRRGMGVLEELYVDGMPVARFVEAMLESEAR